MKESEVVKTENIEKCDKANQVILKSYQFMVIGYCINFILLAVAYMVCDGILELNYAFSFKSVFMMAFFAFTETNFIGSVYKCVKLKGKSYLTVAILYGVALLTAIAGFIVTIILN